MGDLFLSFSATPSSQTMAEPAAAWRLRQLYFSLVVMNG